MQPIDLDSRANRAARPRRRFSLPVSLVSAATAVLAGCLSAPSAWAQNLTPEGVIAAHQSASASSLAVGEKAAATQLGVSVSVVQQLELVYADMANRTAAQKKIGTHLRWATRIANGQPAVVGAPQLKSGIAVLPGNRALCKVTFPSLIPVSAVTAIKAAGGTVVGLHTRSKYVTAILPLAKLETLAGRSDIRFISPAIPVKTMGRGLKPLASTQRVGAPYRWVPKPNAAHGTAIDDAFASLFSPTAMGMPLGSLASTSFGLPTTATHLALPLFPALLQTGTVDSEGDTSHQAKSARTSFGVSGKGIKIGIISGDDEYLDNLQSTGDLPLSVTVLDGGDPTAYTEPVDSGNTSYEGPAPGEGTAMMKIIHDLAPNASLVFTSGQTDLVDAIYELRFGEGCDIIIDDLLVKDDPAFSDGDSAQAISAVVADGGLYLSAAGNEGNLSSGTSSVYEGDFVSGGNVNLPLIGSIGLVNIFSTSVKSALFETASAGTTTDTDVILEWADPYNAKSNDYQIAITDAGAANLLDYSAEDTDAPFAKATCLPGNQIYVIRNIPSAKYPSSVTTAIHLQRFPDGELDVPGMDMVTFGGTYGHNVSPDAITVGAAPTLPADGGPYPGAFTAASPFEPSTSDGPRRMFYTVDASGTVVPISKGVFTFAKLGYQTRSKPDIAAGDGVTTSVPATSNFPGFAPFRGTSAAVANAAAIAALIKSYGFLTPAKFGDAVISGQKLSVSEMRTLLTSTAIALTSDAATQRNTGAGIVMPVPAIQSLQNFVANPVATYIDQNTVKVTWTTVIPATSIVHYGQTPTNRNLKAIGTSATYATSHSVIVSNVSSIVPYYYTIESVSATGSVSYVGTSPKPLTAAATTPAKKAIVLISNLALVRKPSGQIQATLTVTNTGTGTATGVVLTPTLGGLLPAFAPVSLGPLLPAQSTSVVLVFPTLSANTQAPFTITGNDGVNAISSTITVTIPQ